METDHETASPHHRLFKKTVKTSTPLFFFTQNFLEQIDKQVINLLGSTLVSRMGNDLLQFG